MKKIQKDGKELVALGKKAFFLAILAMLLVCASVARAEMMLYIGDDSSPLPKLEAADWKVDPGKPNEQVCASAKNLSTGVDVSYLQADLAGNCPKDKEKGIKKYLIGGKGDGFVIQLILREGGYLNYAKFNLKPVPPPPSTPPVVEAPAATPATPPVVTCPTTLSEEAINREANYRAVKIFEARRDELEKHILERAHVESVAKKSGLTVVVKYEQTTTDNLGSSKVSSEERAMKLEGIHLCGLSEPETCGPKLDAEWKKAAYHPDLCSAVLRFEGNTEDAAFLNAWKARQCPAPAK